MRVTYFLNKAIKNIIRNASLNLFSIFIISSSLILLNLFLLLSYNLELFLQKHSSKEMFIYIEPMAEKKDIPKYKEQLKKLLPNVEKINYVPSKKAFENFKKELKNNQDILTSLPYDMLPSYFAIKFSKEIKITDKFIKKINDLYFVEDISYGKKTYNKIRTIKNLASNLSFYIIMFIIIVTTFTVYTTIKLTIYSRKDEISTLELVGATREFIIFPFYIEGALQSLISSTLALSMIYFIFNISSQNLSDILPQIPDSLVFLPLSYIMANIVIVTLLGLISAHISVARFLKI